MEKRGELILVIKVNYLGEQHELKVREKDNPLELAQNFCRRKKFPDSICESLAKIIDQGIEDIVQEELFFSKPEHKSNPGASLYYKGTKRQQQLQQKLAEVRQLRHLQSESELSFRPKIDKKSVQLANYRKSLTVSSALDSPSPTRDRCSHLYNQASTRKLKLEDLTSQT